jgi:hypothetical protein
VQVRTELAALRELIASDRRASLDN